MSGPKGARAGLISAAIPGPAGNPNAVLNSFSNFVNDAIGKTDAGERRFTITDGYGKAFRHQVWQGVIANLYGEDFAKYLGDAQERHHLFGGKSPELSKQMSLRDLINNEIGRKTGANYEGDLTTMDGLVNYLNLAASNIIDSFEELRDNTPSDQRNIFTRDTLGVQELFDAINTSELNAKTQQIINLKERATGTP